MNLIERARLTGAEIKDLGFTYEDLSDYRYLTDAQLAKALWAVVDWLGAFEKPTFGGDFFLVIQATQDRIQRVIQEQLEAAGIERPQVEAQAP